MIIVFKRCPPDKALKLSEKVGNRSFAGGAIHYVHVGRGSI